MADPATPIVVDATPAPAQVAAAVRQLVLAVGGVLTALGFAGYAGKLDLVLQFIGPLSIVISFVLGQIHTREQAKKLAVTAAASPNAVAVVKP